MKSHRCSFGFGIVFAVAILLTYGCGGETSAPPPLPTATLTASVSSVVLGNSITLSWSSTNANSCTASALPAENDWTGAKGASGSQSVSPQGVGTSTYSLTCSGAGGSASASAQETVQPVIQFTNAAPPGGIVGGAYGGSGFALTASGGVPPYTWSWAAATGSSLPPGLTLSSNGMISGTPTTAGTYNVVVTVKDSQSPAAQNTVSYTITVAAAMTITSSAPPSGYVDVKYALRRCEFPCFPHPLEYGFVLSAMGGTPPYSWSWAGAAGSSTPPGLNVRVGFNSFQNTCAGSVWQICGVPTTLGTYNVVVTAADSSTPPNHASASYTIKIFNPPPPVIAATVPPVGAINLPYGFTFTISGFPLSVLVANPLTWSETGALPPGLTLSTDGVLSGTPTATGSFPITVTVTDALNQSSAPKDFTIVIAEHGFAATGSMSVARSQHTATLLNTGKVLIAGGTDANGVAQATAELFDPANGTFTPTGSMMAARYAFAATLLGSGKVLITGGNDASGNALSSAELYDPNTGTFSSTKGSMVAPHSGHTATLLNTAKVLVAGYGNGIAELFDPATGTFTQTGTMLQARVLHTATLLNDGKVLIAGGIQGLPPNTTVLSEAELYDPNTGTFAATMHNMTSARQWQTASLLGDGTVLITGGLADNATAAIATAEIFDPANETFTATKGNMTSPRFFHAAAVLTDGTVLVCGGGSGTATLSSAEVYDPVAGTFSLTGAMTTSRALHAATKLGSGTVLVTGGTTAVSAELYQ